ncbi:hypothetical protein Tco_1132389 [Tanacetum coccineum]|uniref:Uncharacterized protein n=1 Tax=Tanacetum coccineum TaxID=301880 RepID=A0ABQ5JEU3_9ASTR
MGEVVQALKLVCNECEETRDLGSRTCSQEDLTSLDFDPRVSTNSGPSHSTYPSYESPLDVESGFSGLGLDVHSYRITSSSGPLRPRRRLQIWEKMRFSADAHVIVNLPDAEIYDGLATLGYVSKGKLTFWKKNFTPQWKFLIHTILHCLSPKSGGWDQLVGPIGPTFTYIADEATTTGMRVGTEGATTTTSGLDAGLDSGNIHESLLRFHEAPLHEGHTSGSAEDSLGENSDIGCDPLVSLVRESMKEKDTDFMTPTKISASGESTDKGIRYKKKTRSKSIEKDISTDLDADIEDNPSSEDFNTGNEDFNIGSLGVSIGSGPLAKMDFRGGELSEKQKKRKVKVQKLLEYYLKMRNWISHRAKLEAMQNDQSLQESKIGIDDIPTAIKPPSIVDWKIIPQSGLKAVYQIIRRDGSDKIYMSFGAILKDFSEMNAYRIVRLGDKEVME